MTSLVARILIASALVVAPLLLSMSAARQPRYSAIQSGPIVRLHDDAAGTTVSLLPSVGDVTFELSVRGQNVLQFAGGAPEQFTGGLTGIPFVGPWANRLDEQAFYANGRRYAFDMQLGNVRGSIPIHGFLTPSAGSPVVWRVADLGADGAGAWVTSELDFYRHPQWMKQFPFAHTVQITHRLQDGVLEVKTAIANLSTEPMPVSIGFHPYFRLTDSTRDEWTIAIGARTHWRLAPTKLPTGETEPIERMFPDPRAIPLRDYELDDVFSDLVRDEAGRATMSVHGPKSQRVDVLVGSGYRAVVVWAPKPNREFVCFEPMAGITNAMNLAQKGLYDELQSVPPDGRWEASFWVRPEGF